MYFDNGDRYDGSWVNNQMCGYGRIVESNGNVYVGMWYEGMKNGYGFLTKNSGDNFEGYWINNKREGPGSYYFNETKKIIIGEWVDDIPRTSIYSDIGEKRGEDFLELPNLEVMNISELMTDLFTSVKKGRMFFRMLNLPLHLIVTDDEL